VPTANHLVRFTVSGGTILAVDNANLRDLDPSHADRRRAFEGRGLAILRAAAPGTVRLTASADGLPAVSVRVQVTRGRPASVIPAAR
jgi:beta-galactosidase